jgi:hypothetical protein
LQTKLVNQSLEIDIQLARSTRILAVTRAKEARIDLMKKANGARGRLRTSSLIPFISII